MAKFFWGAATSSHQVEGGNINNWSEWEARTAEKRALKHAKTPSHTFLKKWPPHILKSFPNPLRSENYLSGRACDHYNHYKEDFDIAKKLGHNAHRFSIEWSRIEPEEGKFNQKEIDHYKEVVRALRQHKLEPFITLWHWTLPSWLSKKGGVLAECAIHRFERYAEKMVKELGGNVRLWITINEPDIYSLQSYLRGKWPPEKQNIISFCRSRQRLAAIHSAAYRKIKNIQPEAQVGAALNLVFFESGGGVINNILTFLADKFWNYWDLESIKNASDFIGLNYYFHNRIDYGINKNANKEISDIGWEIYPEGIYRVLKNLKKYNLPVYVTESGLADARDAHRANFIKNHLYWVKRAVNEGVDVRGYFYWSLLDNFEWDKGFWPRFGLVEVDYKTMARKIRPSALEYKKIIDQWEY